jgi:hypothetical protein
MHKYTIRTFILYMVGGKYNIHICNATGSAYLSGSAACHWYFNPIIPEAEAYYNRYDKVKELQFLEYLFLSTLSIHVNVINIQLL